MSGVPGLERGIAILRLLNRDRRRITAPEIVAELKIPRSTVHRLLQCLTELDLLRKEPGDAFSAGAGVLSLGFEYLASLDIVQLANPILARLRDETNCNTHLAVLEGYNSIFLLRHLSDIPFSATISVGSSIPVYATVTGRMMLVDHSEAEIRRMFKGVSFRAFGDNTPTSVDQLLKLLETDRANGYALGEGVFGNVLAIATAVRGHDNKIVGAISAIAARGTLTRKELLTSVKAKLLAAAREISQSMGASAPDMSGRGRRMAAAD